MREAVERHQTRALRYLKAREVSVIDRLKCQLHKELYDTVKPLMRELFRSASSRWAGGNTVYTVTIAPEPFARGTSVKRWSSNGKWGGNDATLEVHFMPSWRRYVGSIPGLATAGGMLTTHVERVTDNCWRASWVRQGRGFDLVVEHGYIAEWDGDFYHGKSEKLAIAIAKKRAIATKLSVGLKHLSSSQLVESYGDVAVSRTDSIAAGNCQSGTDNWIARYFPGSNASNVASILAVDSSKLVVSARKVAILRSLR